VDSEIAQQFMAQARYGYENARRSCTAGSKPRAPIAAAKVDHTAILAITGQSRLVLLVGARFRTAAPQA